MTEDNNTTTKKRSKEEESLRRAHLMNIFSLFSWWKTSDGRMLVIRQRWFTPQTEGLAYLEIIELNKERVKTVPYEVWLELYRAGKLTKTSTIPEEEETKPYTANLWPDRVN